jgi:hypothetical protein
MNRVSTERQQVQFEEVLANDSKHNSGKNGLNGKPEE